MSTKAEAIEAKGTSTPRSIHKDRLWGAIIALGVVTMLNFGATWRAAQTASEARDAVRESQDHLEAETLKNRAILCADQRHPICCGDPAVAADLPYCLPGG